jgi:hypothetical protein
MACHGHLIPFKIRSGFIGKVEITRGNIQMDSWIYGVSTNFDFLWADTPHPFDGSAVSAADPPDIPGRYGPSP